MVRAVTTSRPRFVNSILKDFLDFINPSNQNNDSESTDERRALLPLSKKDHQIKLIHKSQAKTELIINFLFLLGNLLFLIGSFCFFDWFSKITLQCGVRLFIIGSLLEFMLSLYSLKPH